MIFVQSRIIKMLCWNVHWQKLSMWSFKSLISFWFVSQQLISSSLITMSHFLSIIRRNLFYIWLSIMLIYLYMLLSSKFSICFHYDWSGEKSSLAERRVSDVRICIKGHVWYQEASVKFNILCLKKNG